MDSAVEGKPALGFARRYKGCLRRERWLARDPGTAKPSWLKGDETILAELKRVALQKGEGGFGPQPWSRTPLPAAFA